MMFYQMLCRKIIGASILSCLLFGVAILLDYHFFPFLFKWLSHQPHYLTGFYFILGAIAFWGAVSPGKLFFLRWASLPLFFLTLTCLIFSFPYCTTTPLTSVIFMILSLTLIITPGEKVTTPRYLCYLIGSTLTFFFTLASLITHFHEAEINLILKDSQVPSHLTIFFLLIFCFALGAKCILILRQHFARLKPMMPVSLFAPFFTLGMIFSLGLLIEKSMMEKQILAHETSQIKTTILQILNFNANYVLALTKSINPNHLQEEKNFLNNLAINLNQNFHWLVLKLYDEKGNPLSAHSELPLPPLIEAFKEDVLINSEKNMLSTLYFQPNKQTPSLLLFAPLKINGKLQGGLATYLDINLALSSSLTHQAQELYNATIKANGVAVFVKGQEVMNKNTFTQTFSFLDIDWTLTIWPKPEVNLFSYSTILFLLSLLGGILLPTAIWIITSLWLKKENQYLLLEEIKNKLEKNKTNLEIATFAAEIGLWRWNPQNNTLYLEKEATKILDLPPDTTSIQYAEFEKYVHPKDRDLIYKNLLTPHENQLYYEQIFRWITKDGTMRYLHAKAKFFLNSNHIQEEYLTGAFWDTTELETALRNSQKTEQNLKLFSESIEEWVWEVDTKRKLTYSNNNIEFFLGYTASQILGTDYLLLLKDSYYEESQKNFEICKVKKTGVLNRAEEWKHKDGSYRWLETSFFPFFSEENEILGFRAATKNISERKKIEEMKNEFISHISHELRTPLTSIYGALTLLLEKHEEAFSEKTKDLCKIAYENAQRLLRLINDLLEIQRIELHKIKKERKPIKTADYIKESVRLMGPLANTKMITIKIIEPLSDSSIFANFDNLLKIMNNLLSNAIKFSPLNTTITISTLEMDPNIRVVVKDEGPGISESFSERIFQKFSQGETKEKFLGSGLGLSICKALIQDLSGSINYSSENGKGSIFYFDLPKYKG